MILSGLLVLLGLPVFLRMPLCWDVTLYDVGARAILAGGLHYRDVFDTNTPGYVWLLTLLRAVLGNSTIALKAVDFAVFAAIVAVLDRLTKLGGGGPTARWWAIAGMISIYLFETEFIHAQRDIWLALPMLGAIWLRLRRIARIAAGERVGYFWPAFAEGALWAAAVWIKPHVIPLALLVWILTVRRLSGGSWRTAGRDLAGNLAAGIAVGLAGMAYLVGSGTWPYYWVVMTEWNVHYTDLVFSEFSSRLDHELSWVRPWSTLLVPSLLLVLLSLIDGRVFSASWRPAGKSGPLGRILPGILYDPGANDAARFTRAVLAGAYLGWAIDSFALQRTFIYAHVIEVFMMIALWAAHRWCLPALVIAWIAAFSIVFRIGDESPSFRQTAREAMASTGYHYESLEYFYRHELAKQGYGRQWVASFTTATSGQDDARLKDDLKRLKGHLASANWEELGEVEAFLRSKDAKDREVACWNEGVHPLYLSLGVQPGFRFMHVHNTDSIGPDASKSMRAELHTNPALRFVVLDLEWLGAMQGWNTKTLNYPPARSADCLIPKASPYWDNIFPYDRPTVFRSDGGKGRYIVFAVTQPLGKVE